MRNVYMQLTPEQRLAAKVRELQKLIEELTERVESLEADRAAEETSRMERLERGYE